ncbi:MAG TPA: carbohydrate-binding family 9-like protein [Pyrinomonadaceae bacterium]
MIGSRPVVTALYTSVDVEPGEFDYPGWDRTTPVTINRHWSGAEAPKTQHCEVRMLWSDHALLVRYVCRQPKPPLIQEDAPLDRKTIGLWDTDVCEVFIRPPDQPPNRYYEFEAAPNGAWVDLVITIEPEGVEREWDYRSGMTTESHVSEDLLTTVIRIPWSDRLPKPKLGDEWHVNLFRCEGLGNERYLSWQPTYTSEPYFHVPEVFGRLRFV